MNTFNNLYCIIFSSMKERKARNQNQSQQDEQPQEKHNNSKGVCIQKGFVEFAKMYCILRA